MSLPERTAAILAALDYTPESLALQIGTKLRDAKRIMSGKKIYADELTEIHRITGIRIDLPFGGNL